MSDLIKKVKIKKQDGTFTDYIPIGADAINIKVADGESVETKLNKKPYYYNSVADMKADTKLKVGDMAATLGYYSANDGGAAEYKIVDTASQTEYQERLNNNLYAQMIIQNDTVYPEQFGAYGDGLADDTVKLTNMFKSKAHNFKLNKIYVITSTLNINSKDNWTIEGKGTIHLKRQQFSIGNWVCLFFKDCSNLTLNNLTFKKEVVDKTVIIDHEQHDYIVLIQPSDTIENKPLENIKVENCTFIDLSGIPSMQHESWYGELGIGAYENKTNNVLVRNNIFKNPCGRIVYLTECNNFIIEGNKLLNINYSDEEPESTAGEDITIAMRVLSCTKGMINNNYLHYKQNHVPSNNVAMLVSCNDKEYLPSKDVIISNNIVDSELGEFTFARITCCENVKYVNNKITFLPYQQGASPYFKFIETKTQNVPSQYANNIVVDVTFESNEIKNYQRGDVNIYTEPPSTYGVMVLRNNTFWKHDAGDFMFYIGGVNWRPLVQMIGNILYRQNVYVGIIEKNTNMPDTGSI